LHASTGQTAPVMLLNTLRNSFCLVYGYVEYIVICFPEVYVIFEAFFVESG
jgi:hypothetical protein